MDIGALYKKYGSILRFLIVGGSGAVAFVILTNIGLNLFPKLPKTLVSVCSYALLILPVYTLHRSFSFESNLPHKIALPKYVITQIISLCFNFSFSYLLFNVLHFPNFWGSVGITILTSVGSFIALKLWAFKHHEAG